MSDFTIDTYDYPLLKLMGGEMLQVSDGYAKAMLPMSEKVQQPSKVFHAGAIVTLADEAASAAIHGAPVNAESFQGKLFPYSIHLSVNLVSNDPVGPLFAESKVIKRGRITIVETEVTSNQGRTVALVRSTHMMVELDKKGPHRLRSKERV